MKTIGNKYARSVKLPDNVIPFPKHHRYGARRLEGQEWAGWMVDMAVSLGHDPSIFDDVWDRR